VVVSATGFRKSYAMFDEKVQGKLDVQADGLWLYKNILPVNVKNLAFIGSEVSTFNNILSQHLQAQWLGCLFRCSAADKKKEVSTSSMLPSSDLMKEYVEADRKWKRSWMAASSSRASLIQLHMIKYHDLLMADMGCAPVRSSVLGWLIPHTARDYTAHALASDASTAASEAASSSEDEAEFVNKHNVAFPLSTPTPVTKSAYLDSDKSLVYNGTATEDLPSVAAA